MKNNNVCWLCGSADTTLIVESSVKTASAKDMRITDASYGDTLARWQCGNCDFIFCPDLVDALALYQNMVDEDYEATRAPRAVQARRLFEIIQEFSPNGPWLDIGAGSGIFMEVVQERGVSIDGVEPSEWAVNAAKKRGINIARGSLPHPNLKETYTAITCIDVIEHVDNPVDLLEQMASLLDENGYVLMVTPDVSSIAAALLGKRWWHYRTAHIGYFNKITLNRALRRTGLEAIYWTRPTWYFPVAYLVERLAVYIPFVKKIVLPRGLLNFTVPLNLFDSWLVVAKKQSFQSGE